MFDPMSDFPKRDSHIPEDRIIPFPSAAQAGPESESGPAGPDVMPPFFNPGEMPPFFGFGIGAPPIFGAGPATIVIEAGSDVPPEVIEGITRAFSSISPELITQMFCGILGNLPGADVVQFDAGEFPGINVIEIAEDGYSVAPDTDSQE